MYYECENMVCPVAYILHFTIRAHNPNVSDFAIRPHHISKLHAKCPFAVHMYISTCTLNAVFADCGTHPISSVYDLSEVF
jgi:hypothetical protein